jgi:hypothetical protein
MLPLLFRIFLFCGNSICLSLLLGVKSKKSLPRLMSC